MVPEFLEKLINDKTQPVLIRKIMKLAKQSRLNDSLEKRCAAVDAVARTGSTINVELFELMMTAGEAPLRYQKMGGAC